MKEKIITEIFSFPEIVSDGSIYNYPSIQKEIDTGYTVKSITVNPLVVNHGRVDGVIVTAHLQKS